MTLEVNTLKPMLGRVIRSVRLAPDKTELIFEADNNVRFRFYHEQDCCETVAIEDVVGDLEDLIDVPVLVAEETVGYPPGEEVMRRLGAEPPEDSWTWTFYRFATVKGTVTVRWYGASNGYYSERVSFVVRHEKPICEKSICVSHAGRTELLPAVRTGSTVSSRPVRGVWRRDQVGHGHVSHVRVGMRRSSRSASSSPGAGADGPIPWQLYIRQQSVDGRTCSR